MHDHPFADAPNFTNPALVMAWVNLLWIFFAIWIAYGLLPVILLALAINHMIDRLALRRGV